LVICAINIVVETTVSYWGIAAKGEEESMTIYGVMDIWKGQWEELVSFKNILKETGKNLRYFLYLN
jgi:hypothetical protein